MVRVSMQFRGFDFGYRQSGVGECFWEKGVWHVRHLVEREEHTKDSRAISIPFLWEYEPTDWLLKSISRTPVEF